MLGVAREGRGRTAALLASAAGILSRDGILAPATVIGWGETSAAALGELQGARRLLVLPDGTHQGPLSTEEIALLPGQEEHGAGRSLLTRGVMDSDAVVVPSASAARALAKHKELEGRPSNQPIAVVRFGCDDTPHNPSSDPLLPAHYGAEATAGKAECRRALARRLRLRLARGHWSWRRRPSTTNGPERRCWLPSRNSRDSTWRSSFIPVGAVRSSSERVCSRIQSPGKVALAAEGADLRELMAALTPPLFTDAGI